MVFIIISWQLFQVKYLNSNPVYVKETETTYEVYTTEGVLIIKSIVEKSENQSENMIFLERHFSNKTNVVKVINVMETNTPNEEEISQEESPVSVREEDRGDIKEKEYAVFGTTTNDDNHYHTYGLDDEMNGKTIDTYPETQESHFHLINEGIITESNEHIHKIEVLEE